MSFCLHSAMNVLCKDAHILHNQLRIFEDVGVDPLKDEFIICRCIERDNVGVVDVAIAKFFDVKDVPASVELLCNEG